MHMATCRRSRQLYMYRRGCSQLQQQQQQQPREVGNLDSQSRRIPTAQLMITSLPPTPNQMRMRATYAAQAQPEAPSRADAGWLEIRCQNMLCVTSGDLNSVALPGPSCEPRGGGYKR
jgi:hypothetical protein